MGSLLVVLFHRHYSKLKVRESWASGPVCRKVHLAVFIGGPLAVLVIYVYAGGLILKN